jgi:hypothetical protein
VSFAIITLCVASQGVFIFVGIYFVMTQSGKLLDTPLYILANTIWPHHPHSFHSGNATLISWFLEDTSTLLPIKILLLGKPTA